MFRVYQFRENYLSEGRNPRLLKRRVGNAITCPACASIYIISQTVRHFQTRLGMRDAHATLHLESCNLSLTIADAAIVDLVPVTYRESSSK